MAKKISDIIFRLDYETETKDGEVFVDVYARDPKKLITCKDCKYRDKCHREIALKEYDEDFDANYVSLQKLTFCSYGKRKEDGN